MPKIRMSPSSKISPPTASEMIELLEGIGFQPVGGKGDYTRLKRRELMVQIDTGGRGRQLGQDEFHTILARSGLSRQDYINLLQRGRH